MLSLSKRVIIRLLRPYIIRELPAWGRLQSTFVGGFEADREWKGLPRYWVRGKLHGYEMSLDLGNWSNRVTFFLGRFYDLPTQLVLLAGLRRGDTFIDVGANEGMISLLAAHLVGKEGRVLAFEPNPAPRAIFQSAIDRNSLSNVRVLPFGLGRSDETLILRVPKINSGEASFATSNYSPNDVNVVECQVRIGDRILSTENPRLIKIDVEGFELEVLKGLEHTINRTNPGIILEMSGQLAKNAGTSLAEISKYLLDWGYKPYQLAIRSRRYLRLIERPITEDLHKDFLWLHSANKILEPANFG